jgi:hypothetical protein
MTDLSTARVLARQRCVPNLKRWELAIVAKNVQRRRIEQEMFAIACRQVDPSGGNNAQDMTVREQGDVSVTGVDLGENAIRARADLIRCLSAGAAVAKNRPVRPGQTDFFCLEPLIFAIVPLDQVGLDVGTLAKPGQLAGFASALKWTSENQRKSLLGEERLKKPRSHPSIFGEWNVGYTRVLAIEAPLRFSVAQ